mmetsp:Transcript_938/g.1879  ORF Transcript_938/g.1879 Transcript_938/m.1879 type:complete len:253 (-) Transcript_938:39-797(-)
MMLQRKARRQLQIPQFRDGGQGLNQSCQIKLGIIVETPKPRCDQVDQVQRMQVGVTLQPGGERSHRPVRNGHEGPNDKILQGAAPLQQGGQMHAVHPPLLLLTGGGDFGNFQVRESGQKSQMLNQLANLFLRQVSNNAFTNSDSFNGAFVRIPSFLLVDSTAAAGCIHGAILRRFGPPCLAQCLQQVGEALQHLLAVVGSAAEMKLLDGHSRCFLAACTSNVGAELKHILLLAVDVMARHVGGKLVQFFPST